MNPRLVMVWRVTSHCNLRCGFCAFDRRVPYPRREAEPAQVLRMARVLSEYQAHYGTSVHLSLLGGEPTSWSGLSDLERLCMPQGQRQGMRQSNGERGGAFPLSLGITTNGTTLGREQNRTRLLSNYDELTVSLEAFGKTHDELRGFPRGYEKTLQALTLLAEARRRGSSRLLLRVNTVLMSDTIAHFERLCLDVAKAGVDEITFNQLGGLDRPDFHAAHKLTQPELRRFELDFERLKAELLPRGLVLRGGTQYLKRLRSSAAGVRLPVVDCHPAETYLFVDEAGRIAPCSFTVNDFSVSVDELQTPSDITKLAARFAAQRQRERAPACDDCPSTHVFAKWTEPSHGAKCHAPNRDAIAGLDALERRAPEHCTPEHRAPEHRASAPTVGVRLYGT